MLQHWSGPGISPVFLEPATRPVFEAEPWEALDMTSPFSSPTRRPLARPAALRIGVLLAAAAATTLILGCYRRRDHPVAAAPASPHLP